MTSFAFRELTAADFPLLHGWLQQPHVREFWDDGLRTVAAVAAHHADDLGTGRLYLALDGDAPFAYLQAYRIADFPDYAAIVQVGDTDAGIDMLIGEPAYVHRGLGGPLLRQFVDEVVWRVTGARTCWIAPSPDNLRAIRAYEKAGFAFVKTVAFPEPGKAESFMRLEI